MDFLPAPTRSASRYTSNSATDSRSFPPAEVITWTIFSWDTSSATTKA